MEFSKNLLVVLESRTFEIENFTSFSFESIKKEAIYRSISHTINEDSFELRKFDFYWIPVENDEDLRSLSDPFVIFVMLSNRSLLRLQTYHLGGFSYEQQIAKINLLAESIEDLNADIVCLQGISNTRLESTMCFFSKLFNKPSEANKKPKIIEVLFGLLKEYPYLDFNEEKGLAVISRYPISESSYARDDEEKIFSLRTFIQHPVKPIDVYNVELSQDRNHQVEETGNLANIVENLNFGIPQIVAGCFYIENNYTTAIDILKGKLRVLGKIVNFEENDSYKTFPSEDPEFYFDRIFYRNLDEVLFTEVCGYYTEDESYFKSNHCSVYFDFLINN